MQKKQLIATQSTAITPRLQKTLDLSKIIVESPHEISLIEMELTVANNLESPLISSVFKGEKGRLGYSVVRVLVQRFLESFAFTQKLSPTQVDVLTVDTLEHFKHETLEDVVLFFKMSRTGKFGVAKKAVDSNLIFGEWLPQYLELKAIEREKKVHNEKFTHWQAHNTEAVERIYAKMRAEKKAKEKNEKLRHWIDEITSKMDRQMLEDTIVSWQEDEKMKKYVSLLKQKRREIKK